MKSALLALALASFAAQAADDVTPQTLALHQRLLILDSHLDTPLQLTRPGWDIAQRHDTRADGSQVASSDELKPPSDNITRWRAILASSF